jgi:outer membrane lipase/esterase
VQRDNFFSDFNVLKRGAPADALYVIALGGNDIRFMIGAPDPATAGAALTAALTAISETVGALYANGARRFLIWNAPDLGRTPALRRLDAALCGPTPGCVTSGATGASALYNQHLQGVVQGLSALPGIAIVQFDTFQLLADVQANPGRFGLLDATSACIQPFVPPLFRCALPDRHFFWDGIHPTRAGHAIIAFLVGKTLVSAVLQDD